MRPMHTGLTDLDSEVPHGAHRDTRDGPEVVGGHNGTLCGAAHTCHALPCGKGYVRNGKWGTGTGTGTRRDVCLTLPQSRREEEVADAIFAFFLLSFSFSPACTTSLESVRQLGQYHSGSGGTELSGGFRQYRWKAMSHSSHNTCFSGASHPPHTWHLRHGLFSLSLQCRQDGPIFPVFRRAGGGCEELSIKGLLLLGSSIFKTSSTNTIQQLLSENHSRV